MRRLYKYFRTNRVHISSYKNFKAKPERAIRLYSCKSICIIFAPIMLIFRATSLKYCYLHVLNFYLDNWKVLPIFSFIGNLQFLESIKKNSLIMAGDWHNRLPMELSWVSMFDKFWIITINDYLIFSKWSRNELKGNCGI